MYVYRIEGEDGSGPYRPKEKWDIRSAYGRACDETGEPYPYYDERHPMPLEDGIILRGAETFYFGFTSIDQLKSWFWHDEHRVAMSRHGMQISVYDVPEDAVQHGAAQVAFVKCKSMLLYRTVLD